MAGNQGRANAVALSPVLSPLPLSCSVASSAHDPSRGLPLLQTHHKDLTQAQTRIPQEGTDPSSRNCTCCSFSPERCSPPCFHGHLFILKRPSTVSPSLGRLPSFQKEPRCPLHPVLKPHGLGTAVSGSRGSAQGPRCCQPRTGTGGLLQQTQQKTVWPPCPWLPVVPSFPAPDLTEAAAASPILPRGNQVLGANDLPWRPSQERQRQAP